ncbi:hypothetical protein HKCCE3408_09220 [Rhodobacterales bacterium HKCCE3408]|nr:hypothetical protein [Rhodobacterales bacterium HKCCE3408]
MKKWPCRAAFWIFAFLYAAALALFAIGTFGLFGQERDPLSGVFLVPIGLPWNLLGGSLPEAALLWVGLLAPLVNLLLIVGLCRLLASRKAS